MSSSWSEFPFSFFAGSVHCSVSRVYYLKINRFLFCSFTFPFIHICDMKNGMESFICFYLTDSDSLCTIASWRFPLFLFPFLVGVRVYWSPMYLDHAFPG